MKNKEVYRIKTISEYHRIIGLPKSEHPLISIVDIASLQPYISDEPIRVVFDFYTISLKRDLNARLKYGQQTVDFDEGIAFFMAPGQVLGIEFDSHSTKTPSGWMVLIHPDFLWNTPLAKTIEQYEFFNYSVNEALFLSEKEETIFINIIQNIQQEYHSNIDKFSQNIIISQIETLLSYTERFYQRQFITRKSSNHRLLDRLEKLLTDYFNNDDLITKGLPTVQYIADVLNVSPGYLSGSLKMLTGQPTQYHIHYKLIEKAKEKLSLTNLSVSEIAYELGFEHSQSFSKLFKAKTNLSPLEFRQSFN